MNTRPCIFSWRPNGSPRALIATGTTRRATPTPQQRHFPSLGLLGSRPACLRCLSPLHPPGKLTHPSRFELWSALWQAFPLLPPSALRFSCRVRSLCSALTTLSYNRILHRASNCLPGLSAPWDRGPFRSWNHSALSTCYVLTKAVSSAVTNQEQKEQNVLSPSSTINK